MGRIQSAIVSFQSESPDIVQILALASNHLGLELKLQELPPVDIGAESLRVYAELREAGYDVKAPKYLSEPYVSRGYIFSEKFPWNKAEISVRKHYIELERSWRFNHLEYTLIHVMQSMGGVLENVNNFEFPHWANCEWNDIRVPHDLRVKASVD